MEYLLHKFLPLLLMPTSLTLVLLVFGLVSTRKKYIWIGITLITVVSTPIFSHFAIRNIESWSTRVPIHEIDEARAIVVLSGSRTQAPGSLQISEWNDADRFFGGLELIKNSKAPFLIFTAGSGNPWESDAEVEGKILKEYAVLMGVSPNKILITSLARNTKEEAKAVAKIMILDNVNDKISRHKLILVTSAFHMRRAKLLFESEGIDVIPFPVDFKSEKINYFNPISYIPSATALAVTELAIHEFYGTMYYKIIFYLKDKRLLS